MADSLINYPAMLQRALLNLVREVLVDTAEVGLPGDHHLYITFSTRHPEVVVPTHLRSRYDEEMTIVLQNQFWDLECDAESFSVTLRFDGEPARLTVPFDAVRSFVDPTASFGLKFEPMEAEPEGDEATGSEEPPEGIPAGGAQILSFEPRRPR